MRLFHYRVLALAAALPLLALAAPAQAQFQPPPEAASGWQAKAPVRAGKHMVVAAHPLAAEAGRDTLRKGGSAMDAAIAAQLVLNLVEPQSSGIGGGAFLLYWDAGAKALASYDGREAAPKAARPDRFLQADGTPLPFRTAVKSGRSVGVPGLVRLMALAHSKHGKLAWAELFAPAIALAEGGFPVSARLNTLLTESGRETFGAQAQGYFFDEAGAPRATGAILKNPGFAATLRLIAQDPDAFYDGAIASDIVAKVNGAPLSLGDMSPEDLTGYAARERPPACAIYRVYEICGMGPPSSGGLTVGMVMKLIAPFDLGRAPLDPDALHLIAEAEKLAYADRNRYMADGDFVAVPAGLLDDGYLARRRKLIDPERAGAKAEPGTPPGTTTPGPGRDGTREQPGTSQISVVDGDGNAVSMTTTIEGAFGSGLMVRGFLLNNELTDFAFRPVDAAGHAVANRVGGGKRPRSSMAPTIVFEGARSLCLVTGSPGGSQIILYVIKSLVAQLDWGLDPQAAAALPNFGSRNGPFEIETGPTTPRLAILMAMRGHATRLRPMTSGLHIISVRDGALTGGADPRRDGVALGD